MLDTISEVEILTDLDFTVADPCQMYVGCDNEATHDAIFPCCAKSLLICDRCIDRITRAMDAVRLMGGYTYCQTCGATVDHLTFVPRKKGGGS